jgi:hypothetical protein
MADGAVRLSIIRVIDWYRAISLTTSPVIIAVVLSSATADPKSAQSFSAAVCFLAIWLGWVHFSGTIFDVKNDTLTFPTFLFRRSISLSQIRDANAATLTRTYKIPNMALAGGGSGPKTQTVVHRIYAVNLSGNFGGRQLTLWSRKRRDQFLSVLRDVRPEVRITRWASGYGAY